METCEVGAGRGRLAVAGRRVPNIRPDCRVGGQGAGSRAKYLAVASLPVCQIPRIQGTLARAKSDLATSGPSSKGRVEKTRSCRRGSAKPSSASGNKCSKTSRRLKR